MGRVAAVGALLAGVVLVAALLLGGGSSRTYHLLFENGGQLVTGNQVLVAGQPIGKVDDVVLTDDAQAEVTVTVDEPLHEGTQAIIRSTSLSGIANRYVAIEPGPNNQPTLANDATITEASTTSPVDLDQLFDTFTPRTRHSLQQVIQGSAAVYAGNSEGARQTYKFLAPTLQSTQHFLGELTSDQATFSQFLASSSQVLGAVAQRRDELSALTQNANKALGAIASQSDSLDRSLQLLPPVMRQANTTFVNTRAALDDLDKLVNTAKPATRDLPQFLRRLRPVADRAVPVVRELGVALDRSGPANDLTDLFRQLPHVERVAGTATHSATRALRVTQDEVKFLRPYTPDLLGTITKLGQVTAYYDGNGHYARVMPVATGAFDYNVATGDLIPEFQDPSQILNFFTSTPNALDINGFARCPGAATQPNAGWTATGPSNDHPFLDGGNLAGDCDANDVPMGDFIP